MESNSLVLEYLCTIKDENEQGNTRHYFEYYGDFKQSDLQYYAKTKMFELSGTNFVIVTNMKRSFVRICIYCSTQDWITQITNPIFTTTIRRVSNA